MNNLNERIGKVKERNSKRAKENYRLTRDLGFNTYEASLMAQWSQKRIREYAEQQGK